MSDPAHAEDPIGARDVRAEMERPPAVATASEDVVQLLGGQSMLATDRRHSLWSPHTAATMYLVFQMWSQVSLLRYAPTIVTFMSPFETLYIVSILVFTRILLVREHSGHFNADEPSELDNIRGVIDPT